MSQLGKVVADAAVKIEVEFLGIAEGQGIIKVEGYWNSLNLVVLSKFIGLRFGEGAPPGTLGRASLDRVIAFGSRAAKACANSDSEVSAQVEDNFGVEVWEDREFLPIEGRGITQILAIVTNISRSPGAEFLQVPGTVEEVPRPAREFQAEVKASLDRTRSSFAALTELAKQKIRMARAKRVDPFLKSRLVSVISPPQDSFLDNEAPGE